MKKITLDDVKDVAPNGLFFRKDGDILIAIDKTEYEELARSNEDESTREAS